MSSEAAELEEYARKYEAIGRQSSNRRASTSTTPIIDQLRKENGHANAFWPGEGRDGRESVLTTASQVNITRWPIVFKNIYPKVSGRSDSSGETLGGGSSSGSSPRGDYVRMRAAPRNHKSNNLRNNSGKIVFSPGLAPTHELSEEFPKSRRCSDFFANMPACRTPMEEEGDYCPPMPREDPDGSPCPGLSKSVPNLAAEEKREAALEQESYQPPSYIYLDPDKKMKVTDNTLKLIQKQAVLDYYERQKKSDPSKDESISKPGSPESQNGAGRKFVRSVSQGSLALSMEAMESRVENEMRLDSRLEGRLGLEASRKEGSSQASLASSSPREPSHAHQQELEAQVDNVCVGNDWMLQQLKTIHQVLLLLVRFSLSQIKS